MLFRSRNSTDHKCLNPILKIYYNITLDLLSKFDNATLLHIPRHFNEEANDVAQKSSGFRNSDENIEDLSKVTCRKLLPTLINRLPLKLF